MTTTNLASALLGNKFLINLNNLVAWPARTGIQRVCYEFCTRWPFIEDTVPFVEIGMDRIGILGPDFFETVRQLFEGDDYVLRSLGKEFDDLKVDFSPGILGLLAARNRIICEVPVTEALECCRAVISLEESLNQEFFSLAAATRPEKIFNLCHDFLSWTHSEFFSTDWRVADNVSLSLTNRRKYTHNIFTSTTTRDTFVNRINRGDRRSYRVIAPGADGLGRTFRKSAPRSSEFLVIGTLEPRKQSLHILQAFERLQAQGHDARLCFAGRMGWLEAEDKAVLEAAFKRYSWLRWVDGPSDDELRDLMLDCRATIYMSVAEGFGSPPVESLALGVPCIVTADLPSIVDLASNGQVRVEAHDGEGLEQAIYDLLDDETILALQAEIETLELPTWQRFVDGIAELVVEKAPSASDKLWGASSEINYRDKLGILASLSLMRQFERSDLIEHLVLGADPDIGDRGMTRWQIEAEKSQWSNVDVVLNFHAAFPRALPTGAVNDAVAGKLETTTYVPEAFVQEWRARFRRIMSISSFPEFYESIYMDILERTPEVDEIAANMPYDELTALRTTYLRNAIESREYSDLFVSGIRHKAPDGYFDSIKASTIAWKLQVLDQLTMEAAVGRALLIEDDTEFLKIANLDLIGQLPSREALNRYQTLLRVRYGREKVLLRMLLSEACLRRVKDATVHLELIHALALKAKLASAKRVEESALPGMVNAVIAFGASKFSDSFFRFFRRDPTPGERALAVAVRSGRETENDAHLLVARLLFYGTLRGDIAYSPSFIAWSINIIVSNGSFSNHKSRMFSADDLFDGIFGRSAEDAEKKVVVDINANGLEDAIRIAGMRVGLIQDVVSEVAYFAHNSEQLITNFEQIDMFANQLLAAAPILKAQAWSRPRPSAIDGPRLDEPRRSEPELLVRGQGAEGEIITVDQLMAKDGSDFLAEAYRKFLLREPDEGGLQTYLDALRSGRSKASIIYNLRMSAEGAAADGNLIGLEELLTKQRKMRRWPVRKLLSLAGVTL